MHEGSWQLWLLGIAYLIITILAAYGSINAIKTFANSQFRFYFLAITFLFCLIRFVFTVFSFPSLPNHMFWVYLLTEYGPIFMQFFTFSLLVLFLMRCVYIGDHLIEKYVKAKLIFTVFQFVIGVVMLVFCISATHKFDHHGNTGDWDKNMLPAGILFIGLALLGLYYRWKANSLLEMIVRFRRIAIMKWSWLIYAFFVVFVLRGIWDLTYYYGVNPLQAKMSYWMDHDDKHAYFNSFLAFRFIVEVLPSAPVVYLFTFVVPTTSLALNANSPYEELAADGKMPAGYATVSFTDDDALVRSFVESAEELHKLQQQVFEKIDSFRSLLSSLSPPVNAQHTSACQSPVKAVMIEDPLLEKLLAEVKTLAINANSELTLSAAGAQAKKKNDKFILWTGESQFSLLAQVIEAGIIKPTCGLWDTICSSCWNAFQSYNRLPKVPSSIPEPVADLTLEEKKEECTLSLDERMAIALSVGEECIQESELRFLLEKHPNPIAYDGFEPSGRIHIAQGILKAINVNKLTSVGVRFLFWVADWFAMMNNKMDGDLKKIRKVGEYMIEVWKAAGMDLSKVDFLWASEEINKRSDEYWSIVMDIARKFNLARVKRCSTIMGREEKDDMPSAQTLYPCMQCADIFFLKANICQLGMDQRKVNMLAREYLDDKQAKKKKYRFKPVIISHHMLVIMNSIC